MRSSLTMLFLLLLAAAAAVSPALAAGVPSAGSPAAENDALQRGINATNEIAHNVTTTLGIISDVVRDLNTCTRIYATMAKAVAAALDDLHAGRVANASAKLDDTIDAPDDCDMVLSGVGVIEKVARDPIRKENYENERVTQLAIDILDAYGE